MSLQNLSGNGYVRRRFRLPSLMFTRQSPPQVIGTTSFPPPPAMDPAVHYYDPEALMKPRIYLPSPYKFEEAVEFGFPSNEQPQSLNSSPKVVGSLPNTDRGAQLRIQTFVEDKRCSLRSDETVPAESDALCAPYTLEKHSEPLPSVASRDEDCELAQVDYTQAHAYSRDMTDSTKEPDSAGNAS
ncbi:hypothetical protein LEL_10754 [Akanthomyces lecanii RCEF 1005]|uniref:Uncharacterized protein n=1 Tax=Akanthomyces lecanii RCEF 1005 TaxID=1081108 RepID=A0A167UHL8_CORDF|nr:hypothetical protein LEL_10754 [Akanthomyces lecanii RCEF 1005]